MDPAERFEALLAQGKDNALLRFGLGLHYLNAGAAPRAALHLRAAVAHDRDYSAAWKLLGKALAQSGDTNGAREAYREGIEAGDHVILFVVDKKYIRDVEKLFHVGLSFF